MKGHLVLEKLKVSSQLHEAITSAYRNDFEKIKKLWWQVIELTQNGNAIESMSFVLMFIEHKNGKAFKECIGYWAFSNTMLRCQHLISYLNNRINILIKHELWSFFQIYDEIFRIF